MPCTTEPTYVEAEINGRKIKVLMDNGGGSSIISENMAKKLCLTFRSIPSANSKLKCRKISDSLVCTETYHADIALELAEVLFCVIQKTILS